MSSRVERKAQARAAREAAERQAERAQSRARRVRLLAGVLATAAAVLVAVIFVSRAGTGEAARPQPAESVALLRGIPQDGAWLGDPKAPVVVEEYADLQCPFCAQFAREVLPGVIRDHVRTGRVRLRLRLLTFLGSDSVRGGRVAAAAALQDRGWEFADLFYANQGAENSGYATDAFLDELAGQVPGLDAQRLERDRSSGAVRERLASDAAAARAAGVDSTPTVLVGPRGGELEAVDVGDAAALRRALDAAAARYRGA